jgi:hypothetical protein
MTKGAGTNSSSGDANSTQDDCSEIFADVSTPERSEDEDTASVRQRTTRNSSRDSMDSTSKKIVINMKISSYDNFDPEVDGDQQTGDMDEIIGMLNKSKSIDSHGDLSGYYSARSSSDDDSELYEHLFVNDIKVKEAFSASHQASLDHDDTPKKSPTKFTSLLIEKITDLHDSNNTVRTGRNPGKSDFCEEWEDDDDSGYLIIPLTNDEFFELEEAATQSIHRSSANGGTNSGSKGSPRGSGREEDDSLSQLSKQMTGAGSPSVVNKDQTFTKSAILTGDTIPSFYTAAHERGG